MLFKGFLDSKMHFSFHFTFLTANVFHFFFSFFKLFLLLRLSKMPKNFSPRPTLCSGLGKIWYISVGRARPKMVNFFHLNFPFNSIFFLFKLFYVNSNVEGKRFAKYKLISTLSQAQQTELLLEKISAKSHEN